jgi:RNA polymerase sigma factor (sigma-70 family)
MAASVAHVLSQVQRWSSARLDDVSDVVLLERFIQRREEAAFAALVARHGAMGLRSCRRVLGDVPEADDAFQATFLILARKASSLKQREALPGWLHGVARRVALKARRKSTVRSAETPLPDVFPDTHPDPLAQLTARELLTVLDEEAARLPAAQRSAVVLCCLEGRAQEEAARLLGWTAGSLKGHLERGRRRLRQRLASRGIALSAALAVVAVSRGEAAPALLQKSAVRAAFGVGIGSQAAALAEGVLKGMVLGKLAGVTAVVTTIAPAVSVAAVLTYRSPAAEPPESKAPAIPASATSEKAEPKGHTDALGDPLPAEAIARLGTVRFRHGGHIALLAFTPDGKRLVSQGSDGVRVWDPATGKELRHLAPEVGGVWGKTDLSADGKRLAVTAHAPAGPIQLWDVESGKKIDSLGERFYPVLGFSPDGKLLAASSKLSDIELWDVAGRKKLRSWPAHQLQVWTVAFSADSRQVLSSGTEGKIRLWDAATGRQIQEFKTADWQPNVIGTPPPAALSPDGKLVALIETNERHRPAPDKVAWRARISLRDAATGKQVRQLVCPTPEITPGYTRPFTALTFSPDGKSLLTGGPDAFIRIWDPATGEERRRLRLDPGSPSVLAVSRDGKTLAAAMLGGMTIRVLDLTSGEVRTPPAGHSMSVQAAALTPDGRTAVTGGQEGALIVWDVATGRPRRRLEGHTSSVHSLWLAPDRRTLFSGGWDQTLRVWDFATGQERRQLKASLPRTGIGKVFGSPDGKAFLAADSNTIIRLIDLATGEERQHFRAPEWVLGWALTPDGRWLVAWSGDRKVRVWDVKTGRPLREYALPPEGDGGPTPFVNQAIVSLFRAALSPDGRLLAIGSPHSRRVDSKREPYLILKDLTTGRDVRRLDKLPSDVGILAFSPDGHALAWSGFEDTAIHMMEVASGRERRRLAGHRGQVVSLAFTPDGERLISGSSDTTALVWDLAGRPEPRKTPAAAELEALWADLAGEDAARAYQAIRQLAAAPDAAVPLLRQRLRPAPAADEKRIARLIADLDNDDFATRQKAIKELEELGEQALPAYRKVLDGKPPIEMRRRLEELLEKAGLAWWAMTPERLRALRAVEALELAGTKEAREVLAILAKGAPGARLTKQAKAALGRR